MAAPTTLPMTRMTPRDKAIASEARVTMKAVIAAHQGSSECNCNAASTASVTDNAASSASRPRGPRNAEQAQLGRERARDLAEHYRSQ